MILEIRALIEVVDTDGDVYVRAERAETVMPGTPEADDDDVYLELVGGALDRLVGSTHDVVREQRAQLVDLVRRKREADE